MFFLSIDIDKNSYVASCIDSSTNEVVKKIRDYELFSVNFILL